MTLAYIGIGSNLGDRSAHLQAALGAMSRIGTISRGSSIYETAPVGGVEQDPFLNAVVALETDLGPRELLDGLLGIEAARGRRRDVRWGPRTLDLDLLVYGDSRLDEPGLTIPHPEIGNRRFVLVPLVEADPRLSSGDGLYAHSLGGVADQAIRRVSGPLHPDGTRWLAGIEDAMSLTRSNGDWSFDCHPDWANSSGDMFGAFLSAVSLFVLRDVAPGMSPVSFRHRFLHGVPVGAEGLASVTVDRRSARSIDVSVTVTVGSTLVGRSTISALVSLPPVVSGPPAPETAGVESSTPIGELISSLGHAAGLSAINWGPLENWEVPDLADGTQPVVRLWSPNVGLGSKDPYLTAAAILMPIDAAVWPAAMQDIGLLPHGPAAYTPTVEFSATFADVGADDLYHLAEARIEHRSRSSVLGTIRVWGDDGAYRATGSSFNLVRRLDSAH